MQKDKLLKGKPVADHIYGQVSERLKILKEKGILPRLTVILVGDDPASKVYVSRKEKTCQKLGMDSETLHLPAATSQAELLQLIEKLNADRSTHGILVQLPLPSHIDEHRVLLKIDPDKDVDCFHPRNVGLLVSGKPYVLPCTPAGIVEMLKYYQIQTEGKHAVIIGRSNIVGKPMANLLMQKASAANATVTVVHSRTKNLPEFTRQADILVAAMGRPEFVKADMVKEGAVVIDVGINRKDADNEKGYVLVGDVAFDEVLPKAAGITPVPGGVGPMTIAMLMHNTLTVAARQNQIAID
ncbi:Bifunctional protein folD [Caldithrix abyssi DSM 13497]|uniref:Bifunctional protein FolD n=1 Tax=Caldithrix abyssi DSM 13497 TaxID=880073 RepID=H1XNQ8_CALAY|nr:bifunctional methylenetetrahydrofolate dehydrogenase/methenyltetrahydrofolate cyclohydrolase FolD [Caldithrix abyssi]APF19399.1 folD methylenetetrahydrofolate dehydrogenase (NADP+) / methenyltetrahydrofolate cyclohydrolase [Caldithrix abyssi DSM 13497]EHO43296.1 Bifunctional protein folD [Caldithrix abyssi DSM 13497]